MSSSRVIRGTKGKIFLYVCAILFITGLIACYNSTLTQLDDVKRSNDICHQQQDNLSTQLQVISDYKLKLEKSLKNEKAEHEQSKSNFESRINDEKSKSQKMADDVLLKYNSLQQHQQLLQTKFDDYKEEASKTQMKQLEKINSLQTKLKELEEELKNVEASKESIKTQLAEVEIEKIQLQKSLKDNDKDALQKQIAEFTELGVKYEALKKKCGDSDVDQLNQPSPRSNLQLPSFKLAENPSSSTKTVLKILPSQGSLNGARPLNSPSATPDSVKKANLKPPQGVVMAPEYRENQNEHPEIQDHQKFDRDAEKDNAANEVLDSPDHPLAGLDFADEKLNFDQKPDQGVGKKHEDNPEEFREEEDDDLDADYGHAQGDGAPVRN